MVQLSRIGFTGRLGGSGGGAAATPYYNYFADTGSTWPWYGDTDHPAIYFADTNMTWFAWETNFGNKRYVFVQTYNNATAAWSTVYFAGTQNSLTDDDHGASISIQRDSEGYVYIFYGCHATAIQWAVTTSPNDPSAWTQKTQIAGTFTYPWLDVIGTDLLLFARGYDSGADEDGEYSIKIATGVTGGNPSFGAATILIQFGTSARVYSGNHIVVGNEVYIPFTYADNGNTYRQDVYFAAYNKTDGSLRNLANTVTVAAGSLPIDRATARASFMVANQQTDSLEGSVPQIVFDTGGNLHFTYLQGPSGGPFTVQHKVWNGSTLSSATEVFAGINDGSTQHAYDRQTCVARSDGSIDIYYVTQGTNVYDWGGDISKKNRASNGTLGSQTLVLAAGATYPLNAVTGVQNAYWAIFAQTVPSPDWAATESGRLQCYAYNGDGFIGPAVPISEQGWLPNVAFGANLLRWWDCQSLGRVARVPSQTMQWKDRMVSAVAAQATDAAKPAFSLTAWDGTLPALTGDGAATNGDILSASSPFAATQTVFIVAERGTQNTDATTSVRAIFTTALSSGGAMAEIDVLRLAADPGQTIVRTSGQGAGAAASTAADGFAANAKAVLTAKIADNNLRCACNGGADGSAGDVGALTATSVNIFGFTTAAQKFAGKIAEILIVDRAVSTDEQQKCEGYLAWKWGIQGNLVAGQPYRNVRPQQ